VKNEIANNHGSLGLMLPGCTDLNHPSALSHQGKSYKFKAGNIKQSRPKILVHEGLNVLRPLAAAPGSSNPGDSAPYLRGHSSDNIIIDGVNISAASLRRNSGFMNLTICDREILPPVPKLLLLRSFSQDVSAAPPGSNPHRQIDPIKTDDEDLGESAGSDRLKVEESLFRANITQEIEDINKNPVQ
jgi:hypothetical protein